MIFIMIAEPHDLIDPEMWTRPLNTEDQELDATYSGVPNNHQKWIKVHYVLGSYWFGKPISEYKYPREFIIGNPPLSHQYDLSKARHLLKQKKGAP